MGFLLQPKNKRLDGAQKKGDGEEEENVSVSDRNGSQFSSQSMRKQRQRNRIFKVSNFSVAKLFRLRSSSKDQATKLSPFLVLVEKKAAFFQSSSLQFTLRPRDYHLITKEPKSYRCASTNERDTLVMLLQAKKSSSVLKYYFAIYVALIKKKDENEFLSAHLPNL